MMDPVQHPEDERLSALANGDDDARADASLRLHVERCDRCERVVTELASLRTHLAAMPDLAPSRPIRVALPERQPAAAGFAQLVRRLFAPALAAGATLALVGAVGLSAQGSGNLASAPASDAQGSALRQDAPAASEAAAAQEDTGSTEGGNVAAASLGAESAYDALVPEESAGALAPLSRPEPSADVSALGQDASPEPPSNPWLPIFVGGIALAAAALFLRFAVVPRAG